MNAIGSETLNLIGKLIMTGVVLDERNYKNILV